MNIKETIATINQMHFDGVIERLRSNSSATHLEF